MSRVVFDHVILTALIGLVSIFLLIHPASPLLFSVLYFGLPSLYLILQKPHIFKSAIVPALIFGLIYGIGFEYLNEVGGSWVFPLENKFLFPNLFFDTVSGDVILWYVLWVFTIITYYRYFFSNVKVQLLRSRIVKFLLIGFAALGVIAFAEYVLNASIVIPYVYTVTGLAAFIPVCILYKKKPETFHKLYKTIPFLALFFLVMELVALTEGYWAFSGGSLFGFTVLGHLLPIEELLFWIIASPLVISSYHELTIAGEE